MIDKTHEVEKRCAHLDNEGTWTAAFHSDGCPWCEIESIRAALRKYGRHDDLCEAVLTKQLILPCSCGFKEALDEQPD